MVVVFSFLQVRKLRYERRASEREAAFLLKEQIPKLEDEPGDLATLVDRGREISEEDEKRIALMSPSRQSYLNYLLELVSKINKRALGLTVKSISFSNGIMTFKGKIKTMKGEQEDWKALHKLESILRESKLFNFTGSLDEPEEFEANIELIQKAEEV